jgi:hypothetical protein
MGRRIGGAGGNGESRLAIGVIAFMAERVGEGADNFAGKPRSYGLTSHTKFVSAKTLVGARLAREEALKA